MTRVFDRLRTKSDRLRKMDPVVFDKAEKFISDLIQEWAVADKQGKSEYEDTARKLLQMPEQQFFETMRGINGSRF